MNAWAENDELFFRQLEIGHSAAKIVSLRLSEYGLTAEAGPLVKRESLQDAARFQGEYDLRVNGLPVDVKSRSLRFRGPEDYPFETAIVDTADGWQAKPHKPSAVILFSQPLGGMAVVPVSSQDSWVHTERFDSVRRINVSLYEIHKSRLASVEQFARWITRVKPTAAACAPRDFGVTAA